MEDRRHCKRINTVVLLAGICLVFAGCSDTKPGVTTSFGTEDILTEGEVLGFLGEDVGVENSEAFSDTSVGGADAGTAKASSGSLKTATSLDVNDLPENMKGMVSLCDTLNITSVERGENYGNSPEYLWNAVHIAVLNDDLSDEGYTVADNVVEADNETVKELVRAMFGKVKTTPDIPAEYMKSESPDIPAAISVDEETGYSFSLGDRGMSEPEVRRVTVYSDGSAEMEVALLDSEFSEEIVSFIYSVRINTKDTSVSAKYGYEITGQRPANRTTANKMNGVPYITMVMQNYGNKKSDVAAEKTIEEVPYFNSLKPKQKGIETLNARISYEIMEFAMMEEDDETQWHEICSYPVSNEKYVQVVVTYARWPAEGTEGEIRSYNFDASSMAAMDYNAAYALCNSDEKTIRKEISSAFSPKKSGEKLDRFNISGFLIKPDGSVDFYVVVYLVNGNGESYNRIAAFDSATKELRFVYDSGESVVSRELEDDFKPALTHGN